jgi:3-methyladenine DNA glycosylase AlkD
MTFIEDLEKELVEKSDRELAIPMENYMKNNFSFFGIKNQPRKAILKPLWRKYKDEIKLDFRNITLALFDKTEREFHYCAMEIIFKEINKKFVKEDIQLIEKLIIKNSWWDSVDFLAKYLLGNYLLQFPEKTLPIIERFSNSTNMWLNRSAIIFQLDYKVKTNFDLLKAECEKHKNSKEFFIQKAIGWALRDYSRFNPNGVLDYVNSTQLKPLSQREALRLILK